MLSSVLSMVEADVDGLLLKSARLEAGAKLIAFRGHVRAHLQPRSLCQALATCLVAMHVLCFECHDRFHDASTSTMHQQALKQFY